MIHGVGIDVVHVPDFEEQLRDPASTMLQGTFTPGELAYCNGKSPKGRVWSLAARFAAKEAFIKAWSAAIFGKPPVMGQVDLRHIEVIRDTWGRPGIATWGPVQAAFSQLGPVSTSLSISHDGPVATAIVSLSGLSTRISS